MADVLQKLRGALSAGQVVRNEGEALVWADGSQCGIKDVCSYRQNRGTGEPYVPLPPLPFLDPFLVCLFLVCLCFGPVSSVVALCLSSCPPVHLSLCVCVRSRACLHTLCPLALPPRPASAAAPFSRAPPLLPGALSLVFGLRLSPCWFERHRRAPLGPACASSPYLRCV